MVAGVPYALLTESTTAKNDEVSALSPAAALSFKEEMRPRDALERLALSQALLAHSRASWFTGLLTKQTNATTLTAVSDASERAANTLARLMRALREYREPKSATVSIAQVGQANLGDGQVVQNFLKQEVPQKNKSVEQTRIASSGDTVDAEVLQAVDGRHEVTAGQHPANSAMAEEQRTKNRRGKGTGRKKRTKARHKKRHSYRAAKTIKSDD